MTSSLPPREEKSTPLVRLCPDGPILVTGPAWVEWQDGTRHRTTRPVSAVCRCGATGRPPWCDDTHKLLRRHDR